MINTNRTILLGLRDTLSSILVALVAWVIGTICSMMLIAMLGLAGADSGDTSEFSNKVKSFAEVLFALLFYIIPILSLFISFERFKKRSLKKLASRNELDPLKNYNGIYYSVFICALLVIVVPTIMFFPEATLSFLEDAISKLFSVKNLF